MADKRPPASFYFMLSEHFGARRAEWIAAAQACVFGTVLLGPGDVFDSNSVFSGMRHLLSEEALGWTMMALGAARLLGLAVNGHRKKVTPWVRLTTALIGCGIFSFISLTFAASGVWSIWLAAWPFVVVNEFFNVDAATRDARREHGRSSLDR